MADMKKNAATSRHPSELRHGSASGRGTEADDTAALHARQHEPEHEQRQRHRENTSSGSRQSPSACSSGTAVAEETVAPTLIPAA